MESTLDDKEGVDQKEEFNDSNSSLADERMRNANDANINDFRATIIRGIREKREQRERNKRTLQSGITSLNELFEQTSDETANKHDTTCRALVLNFHHNLNQRS
ncbi:hypothetical protein [Campylobacter hyointestinalis]|uniref:hypothetical protein n=1 Tax=Campylobacter hyointestinalis TaxID=198 RepID=UPI000DCD45CE|nr:hypothetical protein [Campylobacter hyointestinalis]RAZ49160.1 hypothetical protein CHL9004_08030 [Campylobacter hyointestinalis subsp. lawsonii]